MSRPTLLNSCAHAATAAEARFRIARRPQVARATRVVALDAGAVEVVRHLAALPWQGARFLRWSRELTTLDGVAVQLADELAAADFVLMVATADDGADAASTIGNACTVSGIMTAGLILGDGRTGRAAVSALRPHARVLLVSRDEDDAVEVLTAVGA